MVLNTPSERQNWILGEMRRGYRLILTYADSRWWLIGADSDDRIRVDGRSANALVRRGAIDAEPPREHGVDACWELAEVWR